MGDGETAEGSVWEAASFASYYKLDNLLAIVDVNRLGQSRTTQLEHDMETYANRFGAFGWHTIIVNGQCVESLLKAYEEARNIDGKPTVILAQTHKASGIPGVEGEDGYHGKPIDVSKADAIKAKLKNAAPQKWDIPKPEYDAPKVDLKIGSNKV
jgi:transketolase